MMEIISGSLMALWPIFEVVLLLSRRAQGRSSEVRHGGILVIWLIAATGAMLAIVCRVFAILPLPFDVSLSLPIASMLIVVGLLVRLYAFHTLGNLFTVNVAVLPQHDLITGGPYKYVRHPAYTGLLLSFLGIGVISWSWLGLLLATLPLSLALYVRIRVEEQALQQHFGERYLTYIQQTKRLLPGLY